MPPPSSVTICKPVQGIRGPVENLSCPELTRCYDRCVVQLVQCQFVIDGWVKAEWLARWAQQMVAIGCVRDTAASDMISNQDFVIFQADEYDEIAGEMHFTCVVCMLQKTKWYLSDNNCCIQKEWYGILSCLLETSATLLISGRPVYFVIQKL